MARKVKKSDAGPFQYLSDKLNGGGDKPAVAPVTIRKVKVSPAGQIRARSIGVSSSSRQRTHKRGRKK